MIHQKTCASEWLIANSVSHVLGNGMLRLSIHIVDCFIAHCVCGREASVYPFSTPPLCASVVNFWKPVDYLFSYAEL